MSRDHPIPSFSSHVADDRSGRTLQVAGRFSLRFTKTNIQSVPVITRLFFALLFLPVAGFAADALPIDFNGVLIAGGKTEVALLNPNTGSAKWVAIGGKFDSYIVTSYIPDPKGADVVILTQSGSTRAMRFVLKNSLILPSTETPSTETPNQRVIRDIVEALNRLYSTGAPLTEQDRQKAVSLNGLLLTSSAHQYFLEHDGVKTVTFEQLPENITKVILPQEGETYTGMVITQGVRIKINQPDGRGPIASDPP